MTTKPHKWAKEIKAWADGAEIEEKIGETWHQVLSPTWNRDRDFRIKPQPKEDDVNDSLKDFIKSQSDNIKAQQDTIKGYQELIQMLNARLEKPQPKEPQPKEPQYLYIFSQTSGHTVRLTMNMLPQCKNESYIGKIKLEVNDAD